jgi:hypothetical protein
MTSRDHAVRILRARRPRVPRRFGRGNRRAGGSARRRPVRVWRRVEANPSHRNRLRHRRTGLRRGAAVVGGFYGEEPSLSDLVDGDLKVTTDFRSVYGDLLDLVLDADSESILPGAYAPLGLLAT